MPYILDEFGHYFFETPYDVTDGDFAQCTLDRPADAAPDGRMYIVNHFLDVEILPGVKVPDLLSAGTTNSAASIRDQCNLCVGTYGRTPNVVLVGGTFSSLSFCFPLFFLFFSAMIASATLQRG